MIDPLYPGLAAALTLWRCGGLPLLLLTASLPLRPVLERRGPVGAPVRALLRPRFRRLGGDVAMRRARS